MFRCNRLSLTVACAIVSMFATSVAVRADDPKAERTIQMESKYISKGIIGTAKTIGLEVKLDGKGGGTGTLTLDPNHRSGQLSTLMAITDMKVKLQEIKPDETGNKGRQLFEISGKKLEKELDKGVDRLLLMVPKNEDAPCWLLLLSKEGVEDMIQMRRK